MTKTIKKNTELAALLQTHKDEIATSWARDVRDLPDSQYQKYPIETINQWASDGLLAIIEAFSYGPNEKLDKYLNELAQTRLEADFPIYEVTEGFLLSKEPIQKVIFVAYPPGSPHAIESITQLDICIRHIVSRFGRLYSEAMHHQLLDETHQRLIESESLQRTTTALLQKLTLDEVLEIVCSEARHLTNATGSAILLSEDEGWLQVMISTGTPLPVLERLPLEGSIAGSAIEQGMHVLINNPSDQVQVYYRNPDLKNLLVIPLRVEETIIGVLDVVNKHTGFSEDDFRIMSIFADQAAIAIETARLQKHAEQLAVFEERQRLARELHDSVTQALYSLSLYTEATQKALNGEKLEKALEYLAELRTMVREAMLDMRLLIFELHPPILEKEGLIAAIETRLKAVEARSGIQTEFQVEGEKRLPINTETELFRMIQEALTNVVKHAKANHVRISVQYETNLFRLIIKDDGIGFDPKASIHGGGIGLIGIQERVQKMDGNLILESSPNKGTSLEIIVNI